MILGGLVGLVIGCLVGMFNARFWRSAGPAKDFIVRVGVYVGTPLIVLIFIVVFAITGFFSGW